MIHVVASSPVVANLAAHLPTPVVLILGAVIVILGILRLLGLIPRLSLSLSGRWLRDKPALAGMLMVVLGGAIIAFALVRR